MPEEVIRFDGVGLALGGNEILRDVSFAVHRGETCILLGVTGTGKTLLLKLALGLLRPDRGRITVLGTDITELGEKELLPLRAELGIVFQEMALFDSLTVYENVDYRLMEETMHGSADLSDAEMERRVREVLRFVGLEEAIGKLPAELSGGMQRRVGLARALITEPPVMLYDSPTAGLDPVTSQTILALIMKLRDTRQTSALFVTHRLQDAFILASNVFDPATGALRPAKRNGAGREISSADLSPDLSSGAQRAQEETLAQGEAGAGGPARRLPEDEGGTPGGPARRSFSVGGTNTRFLLLRPVDPDDLSGAESGGATIYFDGSPQELLAAQDPYLQRYLA